jgi:hypothetical protein
MTSEVKRKTCHQVEFDLRSHRRSHEGGAFFGGGSGSSPVDNRKENVMEQAQQVADRYVAVWLETDAQVRRDAIARLWVEDGEHYVGEREVRGYEALEKRIVGSHEKNVRDGGHLFRAKNARALRDIVTFDWEMFPAGGGEVAAIGREVLLLGRDGRILVDYQFVLG